jgi:hypothetical protein
LSVVCRRWNKANARKRKCWDVVRRVKGCARLWWEGKVFSGEAQEPSAFERGRYDLPSL